MHRAITLLPLLLLAACGTTPADMQAQTPITTANLTASPDDVRDCILGDQPGRLRIEPRKDGWTIWEPTTEAYANFTVRITKTTTGSHVALFIDQSRADMLGVISYQKIVLPCLAAP